MKNLNPSAVPDGHFAAHIGWNSSWNDYFQEYQSAVESLWNTICQWPGSPDRNPLPLLFLVRHTIELGYKWNLSELCSVLKKRQLEPTHKLAKLHVELGKAFDEFIAKGWASAGVKKEVKQHYKDASPFKDWLHRIDESNEAFRYPRKRKGGQRHFGRLEEINLLTDVMEPYQGILVLLNHTCDMLGLEEFKRHIQ